MHMNANQEIKIGDEVLLEQCWEDEAGHYHDEIVTVSRIRPDGTLQFRIGHWKTRNARDQRLQAFLNQQEFYPADVQKA